MASYNVSYPKLYYVSNIIIAGTRPIISLINVIVHYHCHLYIGLKIEFDHCASGH